MRILFISPLPEPVTGQSLASAVLLESLNKDNDVTVIDLKGKRLSSGLGSLARVIDAARYMLLALFYSRGRDLIYFTISESVGGSLKDFLIYIACFGRLNRMVVHLHGGAGMKVLLEKRSFIFYLQRLFLRRVAAVVVLGQTHYDIFSPFLPRSKIHIVPNFAQHELFLTAAQIDQKFKSTRPLKLLFLSNFVDGKGHLEIVEGFSRLTKAEREGVSLAFAGKFPSPTAKSKFLSSIEPYKSQISYHGSVSGEPKYALFREAHLFCLPTYYPYEGQPISILEAYASGCAVLTTNHSGIFDIFKPDQNGILVRARNVEDVANAFRRAINDPVALKQFGTENRKYAGEKYTVPLYISKLQSLFSSILKSNAPLD
jgi:glycosyltransferase involved in cell wall biosynthesis